MSVQIRNYRTGDAEPLVELLNAINAADRLEEGTSLPEMREYLAMPDFAPEQNLFVAEEGGQLVALGAVRLFHDVEMNGFRNRMEVHPMYRGCGLEDRMLAQMEQRARERIDEATTPRVYFDCIGSERNEEKLRAFERAGMKEVRRFWHMLRPDLTDLPTPRFPANLIIRTVRLGEDDVRMLDADNAAFSEHFGHTEETMEEYQFYLHSQNYRPELSVLAIDPTRDELVAGFCQIAVNAGECERLGKKRGWIDILGVRKEYRHQGLGEAFLFQGMHNLNHAGMAEAILGCDSENTTNATALYFRTGFHVHKTNILYSKLIREPSPQEELVGAVPA